MKFDTRHFVLLFSLAGFVSASETKFLRGLQGPPNDKTSIQGGALIGAGSFESPSGAYKQDTNLSGEASFRLIRSVENSDGLVKGNVQFLFHAVPEQCWFLGRYPR